MAIVTGIVHLSLSPLIVINDVRPNLVLVAVVLVTSLLGFELGIIWGFAAGVTVTLLAYEPLGTTPLALLAVAALVAAGSRFLGRLTWIYPIGAAFVGSVVADGLTLALFELTGSDLRITEPARLILPAAALNAVLAVVLLVPARALALRQAREEAAPW